MHTALDSAAAWCALRCVACANEPCGRGKARAAAAHVYRCEFLCQPGRCGLLRAKLLLRVRTRSKSENVQLNAEAGASAYLGRSQLQFQCGLRLLHLVHQDDELLDLSGGNLRSALPLAGTRALLAIAGNCDDGTWH